MADKNITIEVQYDDNGATQKLKQLDAAVDGVATTTTGKATPAMSGLSTTMKVALVGAAITAAHQVGQLALELLRMGDEITRVSERTGLTMKAVQQLGFVATQSGNSIEQITAALGQMQNRLASGDKSAVGALQTLNLSLVELRDLSPDEQFYAIAKGIAAIEDPMQRTQVAMDLFGRTGAQILPSLLADVHALAEAAPIMADETVKALDRAGDTMDWLGLKAKVAAANMLNFFTDTARLATGMKAWDDLKTAFGDVETVAVRVKPSMEAARAAIFDTSARGAKPLTMSLQDADAITRTFGKTAKGTAADTLVFSTALQSVAIGAASAVPQLTMMNGQLVDLGRNMPKALPFLGWAAPEQPVLPSTPISGFAPLPSAGPGNMTGVGAAAGAKWADGFLASLTTLPALMSQSLTGGGGVSGAFTALGSDLGSKIGKNIATKIGDTLGKTMGKVFESLLPGIGAMLGPAIQWIGNKLFKTEGKKVNDLRDAFIGAAGGLATLNAKAHAAGMTLDALLRADTVEEYEAAIAALNTELGKTAAIETEIAGLQQQLADRQVMDWQRAEELIAKYGGTLETLGGQFVAAKEQASWKTVWDDWQTLIDMGADVGGTLLAMQDEIQALVQRSLEVGTTIPAQFKPLIEELIRTGQLVGANGEAITDLAALQFGAPLVSEVDKIIAAIDKLIETLNKGLAPALANLPALDVSVPGSGSKYDEAGGADYPEYATGGWGDFGKGRLALLHGREAIVPLDRPSKIGRALAGSAQPMTIVLQSAPIYLDNRKVGRQQQRVIPYTLRAAGY